MARRGTLVVAVLALSAGLTGCRSAPEAARHDDARWPVVLVHGFAGQARFPVLGSYFQDIDDALTATGATVVVPTLPPYAPSEERARVLGEVIDEVLAETKAERVHLVGHSQGGLDARVLVERLGYEEHVGSLTTVSTPHRGTPVAGVFDATMPGFLVDVALSLAQIGAGGTPGFVDGAGAVHNLTEAGALADKDPYPVPAFSIAAVAGRASDGACDGGAWGDPVGVAPPQAWFVGTWSAIAATRPGVVRANDGLVPVDSARWQRFLGCVPADHMSVVGMGGFAFEREDALSFAPAPFFVGLVSALRALEAGHTASVVEHARPPFAGRYLR